MIEGLLIMFLGALLVAATPAATHLAHHRHHRGLAPMTDVLRTAHPVRQVPSDLERLAAEAEAALERDALSRGVRGIAEVFDQA